jgi:hypothetical protein
MGRKEKESGEESEDLVIGIERIGGLSSCPARTISPSHNQPFDLEEAQALSAPTQPVYSLLRLRINQ